MGVYFYEAILIYLKSASKQMAVIAYQFIEVKLSVCGDEVMHMIASQNVGYTQNLLPHLEA